MFKPTLAAVLGLVCLPMGAADLGVRGDGAALSGTGAERGSQSRIDRPGLAVELGDAFAQVPASHSAYGWRYPFAFPLATSQMKPLQMPLPEQTRGGWR